MHRREPDYGNANYWFRRVGMHPIFEPLRQKAAGLAAPAGAEFLARQSEWEPFAFIDLVEAVAPSNGAGAAFCRQVQRVEWDLLFNHCYRRAIGKER